MSRELSSKKLWLVIKHCAVSIISAWTVLDRILWMVPKTQVKQIFLMKYNHINLKCITIPTLFSIVHSASLFCQSYNTQSFCSVSSVFQTNSQMRATRFWNRHLRPPALSEVPHELSTAASRNQRERVYGSRWLFACGVRLTRLVICEIAVTLVGGGYFCVLLLSLPIEYPIPKQVKPKRKYPFQTKQISHNTSKKLTKIMQYGKI